MEWMDINWLTALILGGIAGGFMGWAYANKDAHALDTPLALSSLPPIGSKYVWMGLALLGVSFLFGIWQGLVAVGVSYIAGNTVSQRIKYRLFDRTSKAIKATIVVILIACIPVAGLQYYQYNRAPSNSDRLSFIYDCTDHMANEILKSSSNPDRQKVSQYICECTWPALAGKYKTVGEVNRHSRTDGSFSIREVDVGEDIGGIMNSCLNRYYES